MIKAKAKICSKHYWLDTCYKQRVLLNTAGNDKEILGTTRDIYASTYSFFNPQPNSNPNHNSSRFLNSFKTSFAVIVPTVSCRSFFVCFFVVPCLFSRTGKQTGQCKLRPFFLPINRKSNKKMKTDSL